ncbi:hypothetical protein D3C76_1629230 [compost metagenome]
MRQQGQRLGRLLESASLADVDHGLHGATVENHRRQVKGLRLELCLRLFGALLLLALAVLTLDLVGL